MWSLLRYIVMVWLEAFSLVCTWWLLAQIQASFSPLARPRWSPVKVGLSIKIIVSIYHLPSSDDLHIISGRTPGSHLGVTFQSPFSSCGCHASQRKIWSFQSGSSSVQITVLSTSHFKSFKDCKKSASKQVLSHIQKISCYPLFSIFNLEWVSELSILCMFLNHVCGPSVLDIERPAYCVKRRRVDSPPAKTYHTPHQLLTTAFSAGFLDLLHTSKTSIQVISINQWVQTENCANVVFINFKGCRCCGIGRNVGCSIINRLQAQYKAGLLRYGSTPIKGLDYPNFN